MKILFCGGGSLGPVTPLLAVLRQIRVIQPQCTFTWVGTDEGPERALVESEDVSFHTLPVAKLPRYLSADIFLLPWKLYVAKKLASSLIAREQPDLIVTAGGFTGVPIIQSAAKLKIPCAMHQLDYVPGLSNALIAKQCKSVTSSFEYSVPPFGSSVVTNRVATPCRFFDAEMPTKDEAKHFFGIDSSRRVIFVMGGGTGAEAINRALEGALDSLLIQTDIIHSTGSGKLNRLKDKKGYYQFELLQEWQMKCAYMSADVVISRAGLGALSELATLKKAAIIIPIPNSHQEKNAQAVSKGIVGINQTSQGFSEKLQNVVIELLSNKDRCAELGATLSKLLPTDNGRAVAERWLRLLR